MGPKNHVVKYYVDAAGRYLGAFESHERTTAHHVTTQEPVEVQEPTALLDKHGQHIMKTVEELQDRVEHVVDTTRHEPTVPDGAVEVPGPPRHGRDRWVDGKWIECNLAELV